MSSPRFSVNDLETPRNDKSIHNQMKYSEEAKYPDFSESPDKPGLNSSIDIYHGRKPSFAPGHEFNQLPVLANQY